MVQPKITPRQEAEKKFPGIEIFDDKETVRNPYSGESVELEPEAVAVYDLTKGAEILQRYDVMQKCLSWFRKHYPAEYMILLD
mgnify:FL=1|jgi:hypothetical protein|tara:strand:- start:350 stop:598 length:249 start_codon:yes stop_codon:yes gene_type:complete